MLMILNINKQLDLFIKLLRLIPNIILRQQQNNENIHKTTKDAAH